MRKKIKMRKKGRDAEIKTVRENVNTKTIVQVSACNKYKDYCSSVCL